MTLRPACARSPGTGERSCVSKGANMPVYANSLPPSSLEAGAVQNVWVTGDGNLTSGTKTQRVALVQRPGGEPIKVAFRCAFSGAPGVIALRLQTSDTDIDADYVNEGAAISTVNAANVARGQYPRVHATFARALATAFHVWGSATVGIAT